MAHEDDEDNNNNYDGMTYEDNDRSYDEEDEVKNTFALMRKMLRRMRIPMT